MSWLLRFLVYVPVLFLILVVYVGQKHERAPAILADATRKTVKWTAWTVVLVVIMQAIQSLLIE